jgi:hypothetical protein
MLQFVVQQTIYMLRSCLCVVSTSLNPWMDQSKTGQNELIPITGQAIMCGTQVQELRVLGW